MKRITAAVSVAMLLTAGASFAQDSMEKQPQANPSVGGPSQGGNSSQSTTSMKAPGKAVFDKLDTDKDGFITKEEAKPDSGLMATFDQADENKNGKIDPAEFNKSASAASPAEKAPVTKNMK